jgi:pyridoxal phosphate enzyme (YggS family)
MFFKERLQDILQKIERSASIAGLESGKVCLVAVTKTVPADIISEAISNGIAEIGESRIQEAGPKFQELSGSLSGIRKHLIGHLQTNKAKKAVELFDLIQSLDSLRLAEDLNRHAAAGGKIQECLIEVKVSGEDTKSGVSPDYLKQLHEEVSKLKNLKICGLMTIAPYFDDQKKARPYFAKAKKLFEDSRRSMSGPDYKWLSMGMSHDFEAAVEEGSNMVRIGTAIFGERNYTQ